jgi:membrane protein DedA with SNARE-associated domain
MREFLQHYGIWAAFLLALLENDVSFIAIGVVARLGDGDPATPDEFNLYAALAAAIAGAIIHDTFWFVIGHQHSGWFRSSRVYMRIGPAIERLAKRFGPWEIFFARFIYGTRNPTSVFWGIQHLPYRTFAGIELLALAIWGSLLVTIGYKFTSLALKVIGHVERHQHPHLLITALVVALLGIYLLRWFNRRRIYKGSSPAPRAPARRPNPRRKTRPVVSRSAELNHGGLHLRRSPVEVRSRNDLLRSRGQSGQ